MYFVDFADSTFYSFYRSRCGDSPANPDVVVVDVPLAKLGHRHAHEGVLLPSQSVW